MIVATEGWICIAAPRDAVWAALHDPEFIAHCVPGCSRVTRRGGDAYCVEACVRLGPVKVAFDGIVEISDSAIPARLALTARGQGGLAGSASGTATILLSERRDGCRLAYEAEATTNGIMARLGAVFLTGIAASLSDMFARRLAALFEPEPPPPTGSTWRWGTTGRLTASS